MTDLSCLSLIAYEGSSVCSSFSLFLLQSRTGCLYSSCDALFGEEIGVSGEFLVVVKVDDFSSVDSSSMSFSVSFSRKA